MQPNEYQQKAARTICNQVAAAQRLSNLEAAQLNHSLIGILGEGGELACIFQKVIYYGKQIPREELKRMLLDEYGDLLWYIAEGLSALGIKMEDVMEANIKKLQVRFPDKYTDHHAAEENRNREAEAAAMVERSSIEDESDKYQGIPRFIQRSEMKPKVKTKEETCSSCCGKKGYWRCPSCHGEWRGDVGPNCFVCSATKLDRIECRQCLGTGKITVCVENYHDGLEGVK